MRKRLAAMLCVLALASCSPAAPPRLAEGQAFPAFMLDFIGAAQPERRLPSGKFLVLNVWASWCGPCRREMPSLQRLSERLDPRRFAVLGMSTDADPRLAQEFILATGVAFSNVLDLDGAMAQRAGLDMYPDTFVIAPDGTLLLRLTGAREWDSAAMLERIASLDKVYHAKQ